MTANTSIAAVDFTETQAKAADVVWRLSALSRGWDDEDKAARAKVADASMGLSSFTLESLLKAAGTEQPRRTINQFMGFLVRTELCTIDLRGKVVEILNEEKFMEAVEGFKEHLTDNFVEWYQPNSTSNADVEIKLNMHAAWQQAMKVAQGKRF